MSLVWLWKFFGFSFVLILSMTPALAEQPPASPRELLPVPKALEQGKVDRPLREKYKAEFASRDAAERGALGHRLHDMAQAEKDPAARFVLLREARDLAVDAGEFVDCLQIIDEIARTFTIDAAEMKGNALAIGIDKSRLPPMELAESYLKVADYAMEAWDLDIASKSAYLASKLASGNRELVAQAKEREKTVRLRNHDLLAATTANKKLEKNPDDSASNQTVGRFLCFVRGNWEKGLPYLGKATSVRLKTLAQRDLANPTDPAEMAALAAAWWEFNDPKSSFPPGCGRRRGAYWYGKALTGLTGDKKEEAEKRVKEVAESPRL